VITNISPPPIGLADQSLEKGDPRNTGEPSLMRLVTILYNSTLVLVGMIIILSSTLVLARMVPILSSIFVLLVFLYYWYACTIVSLYYSKYVLLVRLYYSIFVLLRMILIISSTPVLQYACTIENDSHYHQEKIVQTH
jgi:hypothetical protein